MTSKEIKEIQKIILDNLQVIINEAKKNKITLQKNYIKIVTAQ